MDRARGGEAEESEESMNIKRGDVVIPLLPDGSEAETCDVIEVGKAGGFRVDRRAQVFWLHDEGKTWRRWNKATR